MVRFLPTIVALLWAGYAALLSAGYAALAEGAACSGKSCGDCHFEHVCTGAGCQWDDTVTPNGPIPWCTPTNKQPRLTITTTRCNGTHPCANETWAPTNLSLMCDGDGSCNGATFVCSTGDCTVETTGTMTNVQIDATQVSAGHTFELKCNHKCGAVAVACSKRLGSACKCTNGCNRKVSMECYHGKSYCSLGGAKAIPRWEENDVWCKTPPPQEMMLGSIPAYCGPTVDYVAFPCRTFYKPPTVDYPRAPSKMCAAFNFSYYSTHYQDTTTYIELFACGKILNATTMDVEYALPTCVEYLSGGPPATPPTKCKHARPPQRFFNVSGGDDTNKGVAPWYTALFQTARWQWVGAVLVGCLLLCACCCCYYYRDRCRCCAWCEWGMWAECFFQKIGFGDTYEKASEVCEWIQCCCGGGGDDTEHDTEHDGHPRAIAREFTREFTREFSERRLDIEMAATRGHQEIVLEEIPTKTDSPIRRRGFI